MNWNHLSIAHPAFPNTNIKYDKPKNYDLMMGKINEYGKIVIEDNALQEIGKNFKKKKR